MIFCKNCGSQIDDNLKFCPACGQAVENAGGAMGGQPNMQQPQQFAQQPPVQQFNPNQQYGGQQFGGQPQYGAPMGGVNMGIMERNIVTCIILSLVTCGIYGLYWFYTLTNDTNSISGEPNPMSGGLCLVLNIVTSGLFGIYWAWKRGEYIDKYNAMRGKPQTNNAVIYLILSFVGLGIVAYAMLQNELNQIARGF